MSLLRFLGLNGGAAGRDDRTQSEAIARIAGELEGLAPERARFFAAFAYVLARVAGADLRVADCEIEAMHRALVELAETDDSEARLVVEIANAHVESIGASENFIVTREFARMATRAQKLQLLQCLFAVAASDDLITGDESNEIMNIAGELGLSRDDALAVRAGFKDKLAAFRKLRGER